LGPLGPFLGPPILFRLPFPFLLFPIPGPAWLPLGLLYEPPGALFGRSWGPFTGPLGGPFWAPRALLWGPHSLILSSFLPSFSKTLTAPSPPLIYVFLGLSMTFLFYFLPSSKTPAATSSVLLSPFLAYFLRSSGAPLGTPWGSSQAPQGPVTTATPVTV
jgi:hypothetical protein